MRTKDKILVTALQLLNEHGVKSVTIRDIAAEMGISHGNLGYHYANMELIIYALYEQLVKEMDAVIGSMQFSGIHLQLVYDSNKIMFTKFYEYRLYRNDASFHPFQGRLKLHLHISICTYSL